MKLGAVIVHEADAVDENVVDLPLRRDEVESVADGKLLPHARDKLGIHFGKSLIHPFARIEDSIDVERLDLP